jgi:hypothetical protein
MIGDADQSEARPRHHASHPTTSRTPEHRVPAQAHRMAQSRSEAIPKESAAPGPRCSQGLRTPPRSRCLAAALREGRFQARHRAGACPGSRGPSLRSRLPALGSEQLTRRRDCVAGEATLRLRPSDRSSRGVDRDALAPEMTGRGPGSELVRLAARHDQGRPRLPDREGRELHVQYADPLNSAKLQCSPMA